MGVGEVVGVGPSGGVGVAVGDRVGVGVTVGMVSATTVTVGVGVGATVGVAVGAGGRVGVGTAVRATDNRSSRRRSNSASDGPHARMLPIIRVSKNNFAIADCADIAAPLRNQSASLKPD